MYLGRSEHGRQGVARGRKEIRNDYFINREKGRRVTFRKVDYFLHVGSVV